MSIVYVENVRPHGGSMPIALLERPDRRVGYCTLRVQDLSRYKRLIDHLRVMSMIYSLPLINVVFRRDRR